VLEAAGQIDGLATTPRADLRLDVPDLKLRQAMQALPAGLLGPAVTNLDPAGSLRASAVLVGTLDHPQELVREATLTLDKVQASVDSQRPSLDGRLLLTGDRLRSEDLTLSLGENRAALQLAASNLFDKPVVVRADLTSQRFQLDPLLQGGAAAAGAGSETALPDSAVSEIGPLDLPVRAEGEVHITETLWKGMTVRDFVALYTLRDNVLTISRMDGQLAEGSFHNTARVDLNRKGLAYRADLDLKAIQANPLVSALAPKAAGSLFGQLDMTLAVEGSGTKWQAASKKLTGNGDMTLRNGKLVSPGLVKGLSGALQVTDLEELAFDTFTGNLRIRDGKVLLDSKMNSSLIRLAAKGNIGLDGSLDLGLDTRLGPELSARIDSSGSLARYLRDEQGWTRLPLKLGGSFGTPRFGLDAKGVQQEATKALQQELGKQLQEKLLGTPKTDADPNAPQTQEDPASKLLKGLLGK
jgi:AsmA protein